MQCINVATQAACSFPSVRLGRSMVVEFWHTKCERCPQALQRMHDLAANGAPNNVAFAACALSTNPTDDEGELAKVHALVVADEAFPLFTHLFMTFEQKEAAKRHFGFSSVPHCVVFDRVGNVLVSASPSSPEVHSVLTGTLGVP